MGDHALLGALVIVRGHDEQGIRTVRGGVARGGDGRAGVGASGSRNDGDSPLGLVAGRREQGGLFAVAEGGGLARRPRYDQSRDPSLDLPPDGGAEAVKIHPPVAKGSDERRADPVEGGRFFPCIHKQYLIFLLGACNLCRDIV